MIETFESTTHTPNVETASVATKSGYRFHILVLLVALFAPLGTYLYAAYRTQSLGLAWQFIQGQRLLINPEHVDLGSVAENTEIETTIRVVNLGAMVRNLLGARRSCGCITIEDFPLEIPANDEKLIRVKLHTSATEKYFNHALTFYCDDPYQTLLPVTIAGSVQ